MYMMVPAGTEPDIDALAAWQVKLEWLTWFLASRPLPQGPLETLLDARVLEPLEKELEDLLQAQTMVLAGSGGDDDPEILALQRSIRIESLHVRGEGTPQMLEWLARGLYSPHDAWFHQTLGYTIGDAIAIAEALFAVTADKVHVAREQVLQYAQELRSSYGAMCSRDPETLDRDEASIAELIASHGLDTVADSHAQMAFWTNIAETRGFQAEDLAARLAGSVSRQAVERFLEDMTTPFGQLDGPPEFLAFNPLVGRPLLRSGNAYFLVVPPLLYEALIDAPHFRLLADQGYRDTYNDARARWLEQEATTAFARMWPRAQVGWSLGYGPRRARCELDGLVLQDTTLLLIECKWKSLTLGARQGKADALRVDIRQAIESSFKQALRAKDYIRESGAPVQFERPDGGSIEIDPTHITETILVSVFGRGALAFLAANLAATKRLGLFTDGRSPWALSILDLLGVCRTMEFQGQLRDYVTRRRAVLDDSRFAVHDEWDLLEMYFAGALDTTDPEFAGLNRVAFTGSGLEIERLVLDPAAEVPASCRRKVPERIRRFLLGLERDARPGHADVVAFVLGLSDRQLQQMAEAWAAVEQRFNADRQRHDVSSMATGRVGGFTILCGRGGQDDIEALQVLSALNRVPGTMLPSGWALERCPRGKRCHSPYCSTRVLGNQTNASTGSLLMVAGNDRANRRAQRDGSL